MTVVEPAAARRAPKRNWGAVVIVITGAALVIAWGLGVLAASGAALSAGLQLLYLQIVIVALSPIGLVVGFVPLAIGGRRFASIAGPIVRDRLLVMGAPVVAMIALYTSAGLVAWQLFTLMAPEPAQTADISDISITMTVFALLVAFVAGVEIARAGVVQGLARWSLIIAVALTAVTVVAYFASFGTDWANAPYALGVLLMGVSWWRAGLPGGTRVTVASKSLAE